MSFVTPLALLLGGLALPLVALYFLKLRRRRVKVPSVLLWQAFQRSERLATPFERFRRNLLLWIQLLILLLLVLAAARPFLRTQASLARSVVLVVDTSASMGATDVSPTRLGDALKTARALVSSMGPSDEAMVVVAGPRTEVRVPFTRDRGLLDAELGRITVSEAEGSLREGIQLALSMARTRPDVEIAVLSDGNGGRLDDLPTGGLDVQLVPIGRDSTNAAVLAVDLRRSPTSDLDRQLFVTVQGYGRAALQGNIEVYLGDSLIGLRNESLQPDTPLHLVFDLPGDLGGTLRVEVDAPGDLLPADDVAWLVLSPLARRRVLLVGGDSLTARALNADPRVSLRRVKAEEFDPALLDQTDATLFAAGVIPSGLAGRSYAVLGPLEGAPVTFGDEVPSPQVIGWQRTHPVTRFVEWNDVIVARSRKVTAAAGLEPIVEGQGGPLVLAGEIGGGRVLQLAFDPLESDLPLRVAWPVTLLNATGWLTEGLSGAETAHAVAAGEPYVRRLPEGVTEVTVLGPSGSPVDAQVVDGLLRVRDTSAIGVYEIRGPGVAAGFSANLLSRQESDLAPRRSLALADNQVQASEAAIAGRRELWRPLALAAVLLLLTEWLLWNRRRAA